MDTTTQQTTTNKDNTVEGASYNETLLMNMWLAYNVMGIRAKGTPSNYGSFYYSLYDPEGNDIAGLEEYNEALAWRCGTPSYVSYPSEHLQLLKKVMMILEAPVLLSELKVYASPDLVVRRINGTWQYEVYLGDDETGRIITGPRCFDMQLAFALFTIKLVKHMNDRKLWTFGPLLDYTALTEMRTVRKALEESENCKKVLVNNEKPVPDVISDADPTVTKEELQKAIQVHRQTVTNQVNTIQKQ